MSKKKEKKELRAIRVSDRLWKKTLKACEEMGLNPSEYIRIQLRELVATYEKNRFEESEKGE